MSRPTVGPTQLPIEYVIGFYLVDRAARTQSSALAFINAEVKKK
jgi:hypothetical protein